jgi:hypothetical protein
MMHRCCQVIFPITLCVGMWSHQPLVGRPVRFTPYLATTGQLPMRGAEGDYPVGAVVSLVTWTQRPDPRWFGGMIPGAVKSVEFVFVVSDREQHREYFYAEYSGSPFKIVSSQTERLPAGRTAYLLAQRGAFLP